MGARAKLSEIINCMEFQSEERSAYLNKETGEVIAISDGEFRAAENGDPLEEYPEWQRELVTIAREILKDDKKYVALPSKFDINEYSIMERFCLSIDDEEISESLYYEIKGTGAFRRFKDGIHRFGIAEDWYKYKKQELKSIAIGWCEENNIEYIDDS